MHIDWSAIRRRLETAHAPLSPRTTVFPERQRAVLQKHAQTVSGRFERQHSPQQTLTVVMWHLAQTTYAVETAHVREVFALRALTPIPGTPPFVLGIASIRGRILSILDLTVLFGFPAHEPRTSGTVVTIHTAAMEFGLLTDVILGIRSVPLETIQPALPSVSGAQMTHVKGITDDRVIILDAGALLTDRHLIVYDAVRNPTDKG